MEISRLDAGAESIHKRRRRLGELVAAVLRSRGWEDQVELDATARSSPAIRAGSKRIVANLVGNAIAHGGGLIVGRRAGGDSVEVADQGPGIAPSTSRISSSASTKPIRRAAGRAPASGSRSHRRTRACSAARIEVWSEVGKGSRFTLRL